MNGLVKMIWNDIVKLEWISVGRIRAQLWLSLCRNPTYKMRLYLDLTDHYTNAKLQIHHLYVQHQTYGENRVKK